MLSVCRAAASSLRTSSSRLSCQAVGFKAAGTGWMHPGRNAGMKTAGDNSDDTHDDFKPITKPDSTTMSVQDHIEKDIKDNPVLLYMKGVPEAPQCGFSAMVVNILAQYGVPYASRNVLADPALREGIKQYSRWPTIPQVFVNGEFLGGSDILVSMHRSGELETMLKNTPSKETKRDEWILKQLARRRLRKI